MEIGPLVHRAGVLGPAARFWDSRLCRRPAVAAHDRSPAAISIENSLSAHSPGVDLAPDDLVGRFSANHLEAGEFLTALRTAEISAGAVLDDSVRQALDQTTGPALVVLVQEVAAAGAVDGDGAECGQEDSSLARFGWAAADPPSSRRRPVHRRPATAVAHRRRGERPLAEARARHRTSP